MPATTQRQRTTTPARPGDARLALLVIVLFEFGFLVAGADHALRTLAAPAGPERTAAGLRAAQCVIGVPITLVAELVTRRTRLCLPGAWRIGFAAFVFMSLVLGSAYGVYWLVPAWDTVQHAWSAVLLVLAGLGLLGAVTRDAHTTDAPAPTPDAHAPDAHAPTPDAPAPAPQRAPVIARPPLWIAALFAYAFGALGGVLWEFVEMSIDGALGLNMQRFLLQDGTPLVGRAALLDTMADLQTNNVAALATLAALAWPLRTRRPALLRVVPHWR